MHGRTSALAAKALGDPTSYRDGPGSDSLRESQDDFSSVADALTGLSLDLWSCLADKRIESNLHHA